MRRLVRPAAFMVFSVAAMVGFIAVGRMSQHTLTWRDINGWLQRTDPEDALAEIARLLGLALAFYVAAVSIAAFVAELAGSVRLPGLQRLLRRTVGLVAVPVLRRRLMEITTAASVTIASLHAMPAGAVTGSSMAVAAAVAPLPSEPVGLPLVLRGEFHGFGVLPSQSAPRSAPAATASTSTHVIRNGETLWRIIERRYGYANRRLLDFVLAANPQINNANLIPVGTTISLPDLTDRGDAQLPPPPRSTAEATWAVVVVRHGDTLWGIVERHYGYATADLVWAVVAANPGLDNPDLIFPGQQITLPPAAVGGQRPRSTTTVKPATPPATIDSTVSTPPPNGQPDAQPSNPASVEAVPVPPPDVEPPTATPVTGAVAPVPALFPPPTSPLVSMLPTPTGSPAGAPASNPQVDIETDEGVRLPALADIVGWTGSAALATAILGLAVRRRRRLGCSDRLHRRTRQAVELGVVMRETDNLDTVEWGAAALREMAHRLRTRPGEPTPVPRMLRLEGDLIELLWDTPNTEIQAPWTTGDGGWSWNLQTTDRQANPELPNPCPCLVTVGRHHGADVLLNLETCGVVAVTGDQAPANDLARSMIVELAASDFADFATVVTIGVGAVPGAPDHVVVADMKQGLAWLRDRAEASASLLSQRRLTSLFALRARSRHDDAHQPVIVVVDGSVGEEQVAELIGLANGDLGAIVVVAGDHPSIEWRLRCDTDTVTVEPLQLTLEAVGLDPAFDEVINEIIPEPDYLDEYEDEFDDDEVDWDDEQAGEDLDAVLADQGSVQLEDPPVGKDIEAETASEVAGWDVELKVLGQVRAIGVTDRLRPSELHLAIYLAFHRNGDNADTISTMVWPKGAAQKTLINTMTSLRRKLRPVGDDLFPLGRDNEHTYRLSERVVTDWERFVCLYKHSRELPEAEGIAALDRALELIDGPPFRAAKGYSWAYSEGTATVITETIKAAARTCITYHLEHGDIAAAMAAACQAAKATDGNDIDDPLVAHTVETLRQTGHHDEADSLLNRLRADASGGPDR